MSSMEPDAADFLKRIVWSVYDTPTLGNYVFYTWVLLSTAGMIYLLIKWWKKKFPHG